jgi:hypothetical protein
MDSAAGKKEIEKKKEWVKAIAPSAVTKKKSWPLIVYRVRVADLPLDAWEKHAKRIVRENTKLHPSLKSEACAGLTEQTERNSQH